MERWLAGFILSAVIGGIGYRGGALSRSGVVGAILVGTVVFGAGGWTWGLLLVVFFGSSSMLSRYRSAEKSAFADKFDKVGGRDLGQALANGGWGALLALAFTFWSSPSLFFAFVGGMATVNADTWSTELGVLSHHPPRRIITGEPAPPGTSGAVSTLGTAAALAGALLVGIVGATGEIIVASSADVVVPAWVVWLPLAGGVGGVAGAFLDSLLGASVQRIYWCEHCRKETERAVHTCGNPSRPLRGWANFNNDVVNLVSSVAGSAMTVSLMWFLVRLFS